MIKPDRYIDWLITDISVSVCMKNILALKNSAENVAGGDL